MRHVVRLGYSQISYLEALVIFSDVVDTLTCFVGYLRTLLGIVN